MHLNPLYFEGSLNTLSRHNIDLWKTLPVRETLTVNLSMEQELREEMGHEVDEHQHELAALQDAQRQKMADVTRRHRDELAEYEERIEELEDQIQSGEASSLALMHYSPRNRFIGIYEGIEYMYDYFSYFNI